MKTTQFIIALLISSVSGEPSNCSNTYTNETATEKAASESHARNLITLDATATKLLAAAVVAKPIAKAALDAFEAKDMAADFKAANDAWNKSKADAYDAKVLVNTLVDK